MSQFLRLLNESDKNLALLAACKKLRLGQTDFRHYEVDSDSFKQVPSAPFAYWVSEAIRRLYTELPEFEVDASVRKATKGLATTNDERFIRAWWETGNAIWLPLAKGGAFSEFYSDIPLVINWHNDGVELKSYLDQKIGLPGQWSRWINAVDYYLRPGVTWPNSTTLDLNVRVLPKNCIFSHMGCSAFFAGDDADAILSGLPLMNSRPFRLLVSLSLGLAAEARKHYEVGTIQKVPMPIVPNTDIQKLAQLSSVAWRLKRKLDSTTEISHAFLLPAFLLERLGHFDVGAISSELANIQIAIDDIAFDLYGFSDVDRQAVESGFGAIPHSDANKAHEILIDDEDLEAEDDFQINHTVGVLSWAVGVAFGRFDWLLATCQRPVPPGPEPFDPLPGKSPGMLPDGADPFHRHSGILVDDAGHRHDLARLIEEVLARINVTVPDDVRRWLQRDFFGFHLQRYSKSRRKAPIYWPLSTASGSYTLWVYYPMLTSQTLYTAINDFVEPKLKLVGADVTTLRNKSAARTSDDEKQFEALQAFELDLIELRDTLLKLAPNCKPNHDDGVQITAAPLWALFRHKPWQNVLKDTWTKLEKGNYDWAHLAMNYWPDRVREKCKDDQSLAIAHGLEDLYIKPVAAPKKTRGRKKAGSDE